MIHLQFMIKQSIKIISSPILVLGNTDCLMEATRPIKCGKKSKKHCRMIHDWKKLKPIFFSMAKDLQTPAGLPIYTASKEGFDKTAKYLKDTYGIPSNWLYDIQTINLAELLGSLISMFAILFHWNKKDKEIFGDIASSLMVSGLIGGNPLVIIASLVTMARAYTLNNKKFTYNSFRTGIKKGGVGTGAFIATVYMISGPVWIGLVTGLVISIISRKYIGKISLKQISDWFIINLKKMKMA